MDGSPTGTAGNQVLDGCAAFVASRCKESSHGIATDEIDRHEGHA
jgi:hypothetical protein